MIEQLARKYQYDNGVFMEIGKRGPKSHLNSKEMMAILISYDVPPEQLTAKLNELSRKCQIVRKVEEDQLDNHLIVRDILQSADFLKDFRVVTLRGDVFTYLFSGNRARLVQVGYPNTKDWVSILLTYKNREVLQLREQIKNYISPKDPDSVLPEEVAQRIAANGNFSLREDLYEYLIDDLKPITLSTSPELSLYKLPYEEEPNTTIDSLNPHMREFLLRVSDHEYLCAIIWLMVNGHKAPYVVYMYGPNGGEGKSTFINTIAKKIESFHSFEDNNQFSNYHMYGKAMLTLCENKDGFLLQKGVIKAITGGSALSCEQKGKGSFAGFLTGILFVDSNDLLKLKGEDYEKRRLRLFRVSKPDIRPEDLIGQQAYTAYLTENFNSFINYCRVCYEKVGMGYSWLVPPSPTQESEFRDLIDPELKYVSEQMLAKIFKDLELEYHPAGRLDSGIFFSAFYKLPESKGKWTFDNLRNYMALHKNVKIVGEKFHGIRQKPSSKTTFVMPTTE